MTQHKYDNAVQDDNVYGHALELLERSSRGRDGIHLDLACGWGRIAERVRDDLGRTYVGLDHDPSELESLTQRGFETHPVDLLAEDLTERIAGVLAGRPVASVTFLDGLEHLTDGTAALGVLRDLAVEHGATVVISVPNVTHLDVATKALLGQWDYTEAGLLDRTHYQLWSAPSLTRALTGSGLEVLDTHDVELSPSDQAFPPDHVGLLESTSIGSWLLELRRRTSPHAHTNQFVWSLGPAETPAPAEDETAGSEPQDTPFLSVLLRTQGRRPQELREALLGLAAQTVDDFEVLLLVHRPEEAARRLVEQVVEDQPPSLRRRIRMIGVEHGGRSAPLNEGLRLARGRYVAIHDDDDIAFAHWVEQFQRQAGDFPGRVVRGLPLRQEVTRAQVGTEAGVRATASPEPVFSETFSVPEHLAAGQSPPICFAFPRSLHRDFGLAFDEELDTSEDLDFLLAAAELAGVQDAGEIVGIYRWWTDQESSQTVHDPEEWSAGYQRILDRVHARPYLLPAGATRQLVRDRVRLNALEEAFEWQQGAIESKERHIADIESMLPDSGRVHPRVTQLEAGVSELRAAIAARDERIEKLRGRNRQLDKKVRRLRRRLRAAEAAQPSGPQGGVAQGLRRVARRLAPGRDRRA